MLTAHHLKTYSDATLLAKRGEYSKDAAWCESMAEQCGFGAAADHYRRCAMDAKKNIEILTVEIDKRGLLQ